MIPGDSTEGCEPIDSIIGQERAYKAIELGVQLFSPGYNIFVCGLAGTGKATTIKSILEAIDPDTDPPRDFCYVNNFTDEDRPTLLTFERGKGCEFKTGMENVLEHLKQQLPSIFEEQEFVRRKQEIIDEFSEKQSELFTEFEAQIKDDGFILAKIQEGQAIHPDIMYRIEDKAVSIGDIGAAVSQNMLTEEQAEEVVQKYKSYRGDLQEVMRKGFALSREYQNKLNQYERSRAESYVAVALEDIREEFGDDKVIAYLDSYLESVLDDLDGFRAANNPNAEGEPDFSKYEVNLVLDNEKTADVPVVIETAPNFVNVFGTIERQLSTQGYWFTDFTRIKAGSFLRADGGYLVLNAA
ncbi:MAG: peptidase, partial [Ectothiorhodospiraceae bacterium]|nr:peptidase [Ectothiorhodospiraceae bacterium]